MRPTEVTPRVELVSERRRWADESMDVCAKLCRGEIVQGKSFLAGPIDGNGCTGGYTWAVFRKRGGGVVVLAFDAFEAGRWWFDLETKRASLGGLKLPVHLPADKELEEMDFADRRLPTFAYLDMWLDGLRRRAKKGRS